MPRGRLSVFRRFTARKTALPTILQKKGYRTAQKIGAKNASKKFGGRHKKNSKNRAKSAHNKVFKGYKLFRVIEVICIWIR